MIKSLVAICGVACALTPSLACLPTALSDREATSESRYSSDFQGGVFDYIADRTVYYSNRSVVSYESPYRAPAFISDLPKACTVNAGGVAIIYNDRLYDNLVPNYAPKYIGPRFSYGTQTEIIDNVFESLYSLMGTTSQGTTISGFKRGMTSYVNQHGYNLYLDQATGSYHNLNIEYLKRQIEQDKVAVIFVHSFSLIPNGVGKNDGYDTIQHFLYDGYHTMMVYGYKEYYYYDENGNISQRDTYLWVQNCYENSAFELLSVSHLSTIDDIYIIDIH